MYYELKNLKRIFGQISVADFAPSVFGELLDYALLPFQYFDTGKELKEAHKKLMGYKHLKLLQDFLRELADLSPEGFLDPLGAFYEQEISHGRLGQYFTDESMATLMAFLLTDDPKELEGKSFYDPVCGSGRMMLAVAKINRNLRFFCADIDPVCCKMTLLNMLLNSLTGEVACMDSLTFAFRRGYQVHTLLKKGFYYPYFVEVTDPEKSVIGKRPVPDIQSPAFFQGNLFDAL